jgi:hypothetical protein
MTRASAIRHGMAAGGFNAGIVGGLARSGWTRRLLKQYGIEPTTVAMMKPWLLASLLAVSEFAAQGYDASLAVDAHLSKQAHAAGQKIVELESADSQMALFDQMTAAEQLRFWRKPLTGIENKEQAYEVRQIAEAWRNCRPPALDALAAARRAGRQTFSGRFVQKVLLDERNPALADKLANCWRAKTTASRRSASCIWSEAKEACRNCCASAAERGTGVLRGDGALYVD